MDLLSEIHELGGQKLNKNHPHNCLRTQKSKKILGYFLQFIFSTHWIFLTLPLLKNHFLFCFRKHSSQISLKYEDLRLKLSYFKTIDVSGKEHFFKENFRFLNFVTFSLK